jgi:hypothetical protein
MGLIKERLIDMTYQVTVDRFDSRKFQVVDALGIAIERGITSRETAMRSAASWERLMTKEARRPKMTHAEFLASLRRNFDRKYEDDEE